MPPKPVDHTGRRFGRMTAISWAGKRAGRTVWLCRCDCGAEKTVEVRHLVVCVGMSAFPTFMAVMGPRPSKRHSIDRVDNVKGYFCGRCRECRSSNETLNCRWATSKTQGNNRRTNRHVTMNGVTKSVSEWSAQTSLSRACITHRLDRGMSAEEALSAPVLPSHRRAREPLPHDRNLQELADSRIVIAGGKVSVS